MYEERRSSLRHGVVWRRSGEGEEVRILPDGCMDIIWSTDGRLIVAGPDTQPQLYRSSAGRMLTGLRFAPGVAPLVLGVAAHELRDRRVMLDDIWRPADVRRLADRLTASPAPGRVLEAFATTRLGGIHEPADLHEVARLLRLGRSVRDVAREVGLSERQLHRRSLDAFGYGPKTLARILRVQEAVRLAADGRALVDVALHAGFADQAHLAREVRRLAGVVPSQLRRADGAA